MTILVIIIGIERMLGSKIGQSKKPFIENHKKLCLN